MGIALDANQDGLKDVGGLGYNDIHFVLDSDANGALEEGDANFDAQWTGPTVPITIPGDIITALGGSLPEGMMIWAEVSEDKDNFVYFGPESTTVNHAAVISAPVLEFEVGDNLGGDALINGATATDSEDGTLTGSMFIHDMGAFYSGEPAPGVYQITLRVTDSNNYRTDFERTVIIQSRSDNNDDGDDTDDEDKDFEYDETDKGILYAHSFSVDYALSTGDNTVDSNANKDEIIDESDVAAYSAINLEPITITRDHVVSTANYKKVVGTYQPVQFSVPSALFLAAATSGGSNVSHASV
jgi:hypothetical protein